MKKLIILISLQFACNLVLWAQGDCNCSDYINLKKMAKPIAQLLKN
ncbi:MAG: hypothetical protein IPP72_18060 [Chitinophagaceae bacterium]|nr:hypothetical protein [Chitinophagaceae bacterium]